MNSKDLFNTNTDWTIPPCSGGGSNDPLVDQLIGNAYHVVRTVYMNLGNLKLIYDFLNQYGMVLGVNSEDELKALTTEAKYARIYGFSRAGDRQVTDYLYVEGDRTGILPNDTTATGSWITVATSGSGGGSGSSGEGAYIPWVYANGSATGGETSINVPDGTVGVPFIVVNGFMQYVGRGFTFDSTNLSITLAQPLEAGDEVVLLLTGVPAVPDNPNINDWIQINWLYNNGAAVGGEQVITVPYTFVSVPAVYKNGLRLYKGLTTESYTIDADNQRIILTEPLVTNDRLIVQVGGESQVLEVADHTIEEVARSANIKDSEVILSTDTTQFLNGKKVVFSVSEQKSYGLPALPTNIYIQSVSNGQLTYNPGNVTVNLLAVPGSGKELNDKLIAVTGAAYINSSTGESVENRISDIETGFADVVDLSEQYGNGVSFRRAAEYAKVLADGGTIVVDYFGDSTVWGATAGDLGTQNTYNPPATMGRALTWVYGSVSTVNNKGISGTTLEQMLGGTDGSGSTFAAKMATSSANLIYCNHCINDSQLNNDIHQYRQNLITFVNEVRKVNKVPVLCTPNINPPVIIINEPKAKRLPVYVDVMREVAQAMGVDLVDNYYYFVRSLGTFSSTELVPDGAHPSSLGYAMIGCNAIIPLIAVETLRGTGESVSFANSTYYDNLVVNRQVQVTTTKGSPVLTGDKGTGSQGINMPVILDKSTEDTILCPTVVQWSSGMQCSLSWMGGDAGMSSYYNGALQLGDLNRNGTVNWDAVGSPTVCRLPAGLIIFGMLTNNSGVGTGNGFGFSGLKLLPRTHTEPSGYLSARWLSNPITDNSTITGLFRWLAAGDKLSIQSKAGNEYLAISYNGTQLSAVLDGASTELVGNLSPGTYDYSIVFAGTSVTIQVGSVTKVITASLQIPESYIRNNGITFNIIRC